jgi:hypothetical protein
MIGRVLGYGVTYKGNFLAESCRDRMRTTLADAEAWIVEAIRITGKGNVREEYAIVAIVETGQR